MQIIGQKKTLQELKRIIHSINKGNNFNIIIKGPSGYGKTTIAEWAINKLKIPSYSYAVCEEEWKTSKNVFPNRVVFLDEIHLLRTPEFLYPLMDSKRYTFFFCTNEFGELKEPLTNRCIPLILSEYTKRQLTTITDNLFKENGINLSRSVLKVVAQNVTMPRKAVKLVERLLLFGIESDITACKMEELIEQLGLKNGLDVNHRKYLELLKGFGTASLDTISTALSLDRNTIKHDIEPELIRKHLITITSRGRKLIERN